MFVVWGPLMVGGTYYAAVGHLPWEIIVASVPYGLLCTAVLMGKHIDKAPFDEPLGIRTLPVVLGERRARAATIGLMVAFYVAVAVCVAVRALPWPALLSFGALPKLVQAWKAFSLPKPDEPPARLPGVAAVVRGRRLRAHPPGRVAARARPHHRRRRQHPLTAGLPVGGATARAVTYVLEPCWRRTYSAVPARNPATSAALPEATSPNHAGT